MAQVVLRIKANEGADILIGFSADKIVNNVSSAIGTATTDNNGVNGKSFATGFLSLKDGFVGGQDSQLQSEVDKYNGFMFGATNSAGNYTVTLSLQGENLDKVVLVGDKAANQFPTTAILDEGTEHEKTVYSDDANWGIVFDSSSSSHTIKLIKWNRPNYNACFTTLKVMLEYLELDKGWIDYVESVSQSTSDPSSIQYGVLANSGSANIIDLNGELKESIQDGIINSSNVNIKLLVNGNQIQEHLTSNTDYIENDKKLSLSMNNSLQKLTNLTFSGRRLSDSVTAYVLFVEILGENGLGYTSDEINQMLSTNLVYGLSNTYGTIQEYLKTIQIPYPYLKKSTYRETLDKLCEISQLSLYLENDGKLKFINARPVCSLSDKNLKINNYLQKTELKSSIIKNNKYKDVYIPIATYSGNNSLFGETKYLALEEDSSSFEKKVNSETSTVYYISKYNEIYNSDKNPYNGNTEVVEITSYGSTQSSYLTSSFYKTNITFDLSANEDALLVKDFDALFLSINGLVKGSNVTTTPNGATFNYLPYKTTNKTDEIKIENSTIGASTTIATNNVIIKNNIISFDLYMFKEVISQSGIWIAPNPEHIYISATLQLKGEVYSYDFSKNTDNLTPELNENELLQETALQGINKLSEVIKTNILSDYKNGISTATIDLFLGDLYDSNGQKVKDWSKGEILNIGDVIYFEDVKYADGSQMYWRITGRKFTYDGEPLIHLELQEVILT